MNKPLKYRGVAVFSQGQITACLIYLGNRLYDVVTDAGVIAWYRSTIVKWDRAEQYRGTW